jgi:hypothetical protein
MLKLQMEKENLNYDALNYRPTYFLLISNNFYQRVISAAQEWGNMVNLCLTQVVLCMAI